MVLPGLDHGPRALWTGPGPVQFSLVVFGRVHWTGLPNTRAEPPALTIARGLKWLILLVFFCSEWWRWHVDTEETAGHMQVESTLTGVTRSIHDELESLENLAWHKGIVATANDLTSRTVIIQA